MHRTAWRWQEEILALDLLLHGFHDPACKSVLELWRDGAIRLVVTKDLLSLYLRALRGLGLTEVILRRWVIWFTARGKCLFLRDASPEIKGYRSILEDASRRGKTCLLISKRSKEGAEGMMERTGLPWTTPDDFLHKRQTPDLGIRASML